LLQLIDPALPCDPLQALRINFILRNNPKGAIPKGQKGGASPPPPKGLLLHSGFAFQIVILPPKRPSL